MKVRPLSLDDVCEGLLSIALLDAENDTYLVLGIQRGEDGEFVQYEESPEETSARALAAEWRAQGSEATVWRKIE
jgi:hypothetical protein